MLKTYYCIYSLSRNYNKRISVLAKSINFKFYYIMHSGSELFNQYYIVFLC